MSKRQVFNIRKKYKTVYGNISDLNYLAKTKASVQARRRIIGSLKSQLSKLDALFDDLYKFVDKLIIGEGYEMETARGEPLYKVVFHLEDGKTRTIEGRGRLRGCVLPKTMRASDFKRVIRNDSKLENN